MGRYRHVVDGTIQFVLPDNPKERAEEFGKLAKAWSAMLSEVDHLVTEAREPTRLVGRALMKTPQELSAEDDRRARQVFAPVAKPEPSRAPNGKHHAKKKKQKQKRKAK